MQKTLEIQLSRCVLILSEQELMSCLTLKPEIFQNAIGRGKASLRTQQARKRQLKTNAQGFDRWRVYELLKGNIFIDNAVLSNVEGMEAEELREGVIEYLESKRRSENSERV